MFRKFLNRNKVTQQLTETITNNNIDQTADKIEYILSVIKDVVIKYIEEDKGNFDGLTDIEIESLEKTNGQKFPKAYKLFLKKFAGGQFKIFDYQSYDLQGIIDAQEVSKELILQDGTTLPDNCFVFSQWQGYQFYYFVNTDTDNPDTFLYIEGGNDKRIDPPEIYPEGCFTDWLVNLLISNITLIGKLRGYDTQKGIEILNGLLINGS